MTIRSLSCFIQLAVGVSGGLFAGAAAVAAAAVGTAFRPSSKSSHWQATVVNEKQIRTRKLRALTRKLLLSEGCCQGSICTLDVGRESSILFWNRMTCCIDNRIAVQVLACPFLDLRESLIGLLLSR